MDDFLSTVAMWTGNMTSAELRTMISMADAQVRSGNDWIEIGFLELRRKGKMSCNSTLATALEGLYAKGAVVRLDKAMNGRRGYYRVNLGWTPRKVRSQDKIAA